MNNLIPLAKLSETHRIELEGKDERIAELEKSGNEMAIIIAELRSEVLVLEHQVKRYKKGQGE